MNTIISKKIDLKRAFALIMLVVLVFSFGACGSRKERESHEKEQREKPGVTTVEKLNKGDEDNKEVIDENIQGDETNKDLYDATGEFAFGLLKECNESNKNILVSPTSVMFALGMTANGGVGDTLKEMESLLGGEGTDIGSINSLYKNYANRLESAEEIKVSIANSIWINKDILTSVKETFLSVCDSFYGADVYKASFDGETIEMVNKWVEENTDGMIKKLLDTFEGDEAMMLINAIAFDGKWVEIYYENQVKDTTFTTIEGKECNIQGMYSDERVYIEDENTTGFVKDYKGGYRFVAMLPKEDISVDEYIDGLTYDKYRKLMESKREAKVSAMLPKFQYDYSKEMKDALMEMGMTSAFESSLADFSNITEDDVNLYIGRVLHKTYIEVAEEGTRAAAVTAVLMDSNTAVIEEEIKKVFLDRPFVYMIIDEENEMPLFMGVVREL